MVKAVRYQPEKGDLVFMQFTPHSGREQAGHRPGIVLTPKKFNLAVGLAFVAPITSRVRGGAFEVPLPARGKLTGVVLSQQTKSVDWTSRQITFHSRAPQHVVDAVLERVRLILEL
jgi:mRNA interferase MazF